MCTAVSYKPHDHYFGRTLDVECYRQEKVVITPRAYPLAFRQMGMLPRHHALIGMAHMEEGYPLYYEATNEMGLSMAALNFPRSARYQPVSPCRDNLAPFELIPWVLGQCTDAKEARALLEKANLWEEPFSQELALTPLHWLVADRDTAFAAEPLEEGLKLWDDPAGVLTNHPPLDWQMTNLARYMSLQADPPQNLFAPGLDLDRFGEGESALALPGGWSSADRFVRAAFVRGNLVCGPEEEEGVAGFFGILAAVEVPRGCVKLGGGRCRHTLYSSCCNTDRGTYYYTTPGSGRINAVELYRENLDGTTPVAYPLQTAPAFCLQN